MIQYKGQIQLDGYMYMYNIIIKFALVLIYLHYGRILKKKKKKTAKAGEFSFLSFFFGRLEIKLKKEGEFSETTQEFNNKKV